MKTQKQVRTLFGKPFDEIWKYSSNPTTAQTQQYFQWPLDRGSVRSVTDTLVYNEIQRQIGSRKTINEKKYTRHVPAHDPIVGLKKVVKHLEKQPQREDDSIAWFF